MSFLGIDLGTSGLRALLVDEEGQPIGSSEQSYEVSKPRPGWSEQDPADWIAALEGAVADLRARFSAFSDLRGIGVAGHMHGATLLDQTGSVLRPCILWNDQRSFREAALLDATKGVRDLSGNIVFPGFTAPKLLWVRNNEPDLFEKVHKVLLPAAYLNHYLTGDFVADMSDSAGTSWLDVSERAWSAQLLSDGGMRKDQMPRLIEGAAPAGALRAALAQRWGLQGEVVIAGGAGDNAAAACGIGALHEGEGFVSLGTSGVILVARDRYAPAPETAVHTFCHAVPGQWYQMGVMLSATDSLNWLARLVRRTPGALTDALGPDLRAPGKARFYPYLSGERTPHNDAAVRGGFTGIGTETSEEDLTQAVVEGVAFGLRDSYEALRSTGAPIRMLNAIGGGSSSKYWLSLIATCLNIPLQLPRGREFGAALGAARLGCIAATGAAPATVISAPEPSEMIEPNPALQDAFEESYQSFRQSFQGWRAIH